MENIAILATFSQHFLTPTRPILMPQKPSFHHILTQGIGCFLSLISRDTQMPLWLWIPMWGATKTYEICIRSKISFYFHFGLQSLVTVWFMHKKTVWLCLEKTFFGGLNTLFDDVKPIPEGNLQMLNSCLQVENYCRRITWQMFNSIRIYLHSTKS